MRSRDGVARAGRWVLAANVLFSALALGAQHTPVLAISGVLAAVAAGLLWYESDALRARPAATALVTVCVLLVGYTALQAVPLPAGLVAFIAPENADVWARALSPLREPGPAFVPLSLDPVATRVQVLRGFTYLLTLVAALRVAHRPEGVAFLERVLVGSGLAMAAAALLHPAFGAHKVFGAYQPGEVYAYAPTHISPLLNTNHLSGYLNIGLLVAFASTLKSRAALPRPVAIAAVLVLLATGVWAASRGGTGAMLVGLLLSVVLAFASRRGDGSALLTGALVILTTAGGVALMVLAQSEDVRVGLSDVDLSKFRLFANGLDLLRRHGLFGVGRGAFESVFPSVRRGGEHLVFTHPEDIFVQWTTEWGVPLAVLAFAGIAWALRPAAVLARTEPPVGPWAALAAAAVHNVVDFNSEVPGVVIALAVCAAIVTGGTGARRDARARVEKWSSHPNLLGVAGGVAVVAAVALTLPSAHGELYNEQRAFPELVNAGPPKEALRERLRDAMLRHPAEPYFPFIGALRATLARDESVIPWVSRVLERSPTYGRAHLLLARSLYLRNPSQARLEYRLACEQDSLMCEAAAQEGARLVGDLDDALELAPEGKGGLVLLDKLASTLGARLPATVARIDAAILARDPVATASLRRVAEGKLTDLRGGEPWCEGASCVDESLAAAVKLRDASPASCDGHVLVAEVKIASGAVRDGLDLLERALDTVSDRAACGRKYVSLVAATKQSARLDAAIDRLTRAGCLDVVDCVSNLAFAASTESERGNGRRAVALYKRAFERAPERDDLLVLVAELATRQAMHGEAFEAYTKLAQRQPADARWAAGVQREREALQRDAFDRR